MYFDHKYVASLNSMFVFPFQIENVVRMNE